MASNFRILKYSNIGKCPHFIMVPEHYRDDGTCKCDDQNETIMAEWGYEWNGRIWDAPTEDDDV